MEKKFSEVVSADCIQFQASLTAFQHLHRRLFLTAQMQTVDTVLLPLHC